MLKRAADTVLRLVQYAAGAWIALLLLAHLTILAIGDGDTPAMRVVRCKDKFNNPRDGCVMRLASACATR